MILMSWKSFNKSMFFFTSLHLQGSSNSWRNDDSCMHMQICWYVKITQEHNVMKFILNISTQHALIHTFMQSAIHDTGLKLQQFSIVSFEPLKTITIYI